MKAFEYTSLVFHNVKQKSTFLLESTSTKREEVTGGSTQVRKLQVELSENPKKLQQFDANGETTHPPPRDSIVAAAIAH